MSGETPRLTAAMAQTVVDLINDGDVTEFTDEESAAIAAVQAIATGTHVVVPAAVLRAAIEALGEYTSTCETLDALHAALAAAEGKERG